MIKNILNAPTKNLFNIGFKEPCSKFERFLSTLCESVELTYLNSTSPAYIQLTFIRPDYDPFGQKIVEYFLDEKSNGNSLAYCLYSKDDPNTVVEQINLYWTRLVHASLVDNTTEKTPAKIVIKLATL